MSTPPRPVLEPLESRLLFAVDVLSYRNDLASTGLNAAESALTPAAVSGGTFGKLFQVPLDGQVYAQPLVKTGVVVPGQPQPRDVAYVATQHNSLYAIDTADGAILWKRSFLDVSNPANNTLGATSISTVPNADVYSPDIAPEIGITSTPVIDPATGTLYAVAKTKETIAGADHYVQRLHAIALDTGASRTAPFLIGDTYDGFTNNTPVYVYGTGENSVTDPYNGTGRKVVQFDARRQLQRPGLTLVNNQVYVAWASHGGNGPYHGWVATWDVSNLASGMRLAGVFCTSPNSGAAGIWQGGDRLTFESDGSAFYFATGVGPISTPPPVDATGFPSGGFYSNSVLKVVADPTTTPTTQGVNGWGLKVADFFMAYNWRALDAIDNDLGSGGPVLLPASMGVPGHPRLLLVAGKEGKAYVIDRDNMGGYQKDTDRVLNAVPDGQGHITPPAQLTGSFSTPAVFAGRIYWVSAYGDVARAFSLTSTGSLTLTSDTADRLGYLPGSPVVSASGTAGGVVWVTDREKNRLRAYDATSFDTELWNSGQKVGDAVGGVVKFASPTVANGRVLVGTLDSLVIYGLGAVASAPLAPEGLTAVPFSGTAVALSWADPTPTAHRATAYRIEVSVGGTVAFQTVAPGGVTAFLVSGLSRATSYTFRVTGVNDVGASPPSPPATARTLDTPPIVGQEPAAPTGLAGAASGPTTIQLTWVNGSSNQTGFYLDRAADLTFTSGLVTQLVPAGVTRFTDSAPGLAPGVRVSYRLRAYNDSGSSPFSAPATVVMPVAPPTPTELRVVAAEARSVRLSWMDNAGPSSLSLSGADGYRILKRVATGSAPYTVAALLPPGPASRVIYFWTDTDVQPSTSYAYRVVAYNAVGYNDYAGVSLTTPPLAPANLGATAGATLRLSWSPVAGPASQVISYTVYRDSVSGPPARTVLATGITTATFVDTTAVTGQRYFYAVTASNGAATSAFSNEAAATAGSLTLGLFPAAGDVGGAAPPGSAAFDPATGTYALSAGGADIWGASDQFYFLSRQANGDVTLVARVAAPLETHFAAKAGVTIRESSAPGARHVTLALWPGGNLELLTRSVTDGETTSEATGEGGTLLYLRLERRGSTITAYRSADGVTWTSVGAPRTLSLPATATVGLALTAHADGAATQATFDKVTLLGTSPLPAPSSLRATAASGTQVNLTWNDRSQGETGFRVEVATDSGFTSGLRWYTAAANATGFAVTGLLPTTNYIFRVRALDAAGQTAPSGVASATTPALPAVGLFTTRTDVGGARPAGSATFAPATGVYTVSGGGADVWGTADQAYVLSRSVTGDVTVIARVVSLQETSFAAKAGITLRESSAAGSRHVTLVVWPGGNCELLVRDVTGGVTTSTLAALGGVPLWLRLERRGDTFTAYRSDDGVSWTVVGAALTVPMAATVAAGLIVNSHTDGAASTATFDRVSVLGVSTLPAPASLRATASSGTQVDLTWTDRSAGETGFRVEQATDAAFASGLRTLAAPANATALAVTGLLPTTTYFFRVRAVDAAGQTAPSGVASATTLALPAVGLFTTRTDVGGARPAGSATFAPATGVYTVSGGGADVWGTADQAYVLSRSAAGDVTLVARVLGVQQTNFAAKAGITLRESSSAGSRHVTLVVWPGGNCELLVRDVSGGVTTSTLAALGGVPLWLRLERRGDTFTAYRSDDGVSWTVVGAALTVPMATTVAAGLIVNSHTDGAASTATFDRVTLTGATSLAAPASLTAAALAPTVVNLTWARPGKGETRFRVEQGTNPAFSGVVRVLTALASATGLTLRDLAPATTYFFRVRAQNDFGVTAPSNVASATTTAAPALGVFAGQTDVGGARPAGSAAFDASRGVYTVTGAGADVWRSADQFSLASRSATGDVTLVARVLSLQNTFLTAKAGITLRESSAAGSRHVTLVVWPGGNCELLVRGDTGGETTSAHAAVGGVPLWLKLERRGDTFTAYRSDDGVSWTVVGTPQTVPMAATVAAGLVVCSRVDGTSNTATFSDVRIDGQSDTPPVTVQAAKASSAGDTLAGLETWFRLTQGRVEPEGEDALTAVLARVEQSPEAARAWVAGRLDRLAARATRPPSLTTGLRDRLAGLED